MNDHYHPINDEYHQALTETLDSHLKSIRWLTFGILALAVGSMANTVLWMIS